jgi:oligopeptide transport system substrate-binding protein
MKKNMLFWALLIDLSKDAASGASRLAEILAESASKALWFLLPFLLLFSSCTRKSNAISTKPNEMRINIGSEPNTFDPRKARDLISLNLTKMVFEGLFRIDPEGKPAFGLVEEYSLSVDLKTYTFHLRESVWSDGIRATSEDFAYAWKKVLDPQFVADNAFLLYPIKNAKGIKKGEISPDALGIQTPNPLTLIVELESPAPYFLDLTTSPVFFPIAKHLDEKDPAWSNHSETFVSNGPFQIASWKHNGSIELIKNERYWDKEHVELEKLDLIMVHEDVEPLMFEKGELDWAGSPISTLPVEMIPHFQKKKTLQSTPLLGTYFLRNNIEKPPLHLPEIRKALALSIDRKAIIALTNGTQMPATSLVPPCMGLRKNPYFQDADFEEALELFEEGLKKGGYTRETLPKITLTYASLQRNHVIAQALQQQLLQTLGIEVQLEAIERKVFFDRISKKDYQLGYCSWIADFNDASNFLSVFKSKEVGMNNTNWDHSHFRSLLNQAEQSSDIQERLILLGNAEQILIDEMPITPLFHTLALYLKDERIEGIVLSPTGSIDFKWAHFKPCGDQ